MKFENGAILRVGDRRVHKRGAERSTMMLITTAGFDVLESSEGEVSVNKVGDYPRNENSSRIQQRQANRHVGKVPRSERPMSLATAAKEYIWLFDLRHGISIEEIATREGLSAGRVRSGVTRAKGLEKKSSQDSPNLPMGGNGDIVQGPRLIPLFPIGPYTPQSACPHREPIGKGSAFCCMVCHRSGMDDHPALQRDPRTEPTPETKPEAVPQPDPQPKSGESLETRKERRRRKFDRPAATAGGCSE